MILLNDFAVCCNFTLFCGLIILAIIIRANPLFERKKNMIFMIAIVVNLVALMAISLDYTFQVSGIPSYYVQRRVTSFFNFVLSPMIPFLLYRLFHRERVHPLFYLPLGINFVACLLSMWHPIVFLIEAGNTYRRGSFFFLPITISFFYILVLVLKPASSHAQKKKKERIFLIGVIFFLILSMFLEIQFQLYFISWNASAMCIILYYMLLNLHYFSLDTLTGVFSRTMYNHALDRVRSGNGSILAMIDINCFKEINDQHGHDAGDQCLISFSKILTDAFAKTATLYRIGGDEFVLVSKDMNEEKFKACLKKAKSDAAQVQISFACGVALHQSGEDLQKTLERVDQSMYANKAAMKHTDLKTPCLKND